MAEQPELSSTKIADEDYDNVMDTNLRGHWWLLQEQTEQMLKQGGDGYAIVEVSSIQGLIGTASETCLYSGKTCCRRLGEVSRGWNWPHKESVSTASLLWLRLHH
ncbi:SDR family NAD(P)-dependent oxidoreductase [Bombilactobacillus bombi]|uniref:SDR family NAD(P)-dependent oxidoreductase n=1 Tax=Bombilactobacillus bombi TaxID=1303590 RepID=UPI0015E5DA9F|nr:SDR family NAD(P)-dependent oxidoreductase [Bombilactobacillus bombi]